MQKPDFRRVCDVVAGGLLLAAFLGCGAFLGYWLAAENTCQAHIEEIDRLQKSHEAALHAITGRQKHAADTVVQAARMVPAAAEIAQGAAAIAGKAAKAAGVPAAAIERYRTAINIQRANERIRGEGAR